MSPAIAKRRPTRRKPAPAQEIQGEDAAQLVMALARKDPKVWFETYARIVPKGDDPEPIKPKLNALQRRVFAVWEYCQREGIPCSIIVCKPRQGGSSTGAIGLGYHIVQGRPGTNRMRIMGGKYKQVANLWRILETYAARDTCIWPKGKMQVLEKVARSGASDVTQETANDPDAGRSGTFRVVIITELGRWRDSGVANAGKVLSGFLACCPRRPGTLRLIESTAQGVGGEFHSRYFKAVPYEEFLAGKRNETGFCRIFAAWFEFDDYVKVLTREEEEALEQDLDAEEREMRDRYNLTLGQLAWRRETIAGECEGDVDKFKQEYPSNEDEAFLSSGKPRFSRDGLAKQDALSRGAERILEYGDISLSEDWRAAWQPTSEEESVIHLYEHPRHGREYILIVDPMTGETQANGKDPDCHSVIVLRKGYLDEHGIWHPPAMAARIRPPRRDYKYACRWDADVLEATIYRMALYYGNCRIVVEMNKDIGITELLKARGRDKDTRHPAPKPRLYEREVFNEREQRRTKSLGWMTTSGNREALINSLAQAIRKTGDEGAGIEIRCPHAISECRHFEVAPSGRSEAVDGWHDDDVLALAIGVQCLGQATVYVEPVVKRVDPPEVRKLLGGVKKRRPGMYS